MCDYQYPGSELDVFAIARNWKAYLRKMITPYVSGRVLEVGAGIGKTTQTLIDLPHDSWHCIEPDRRLLSRLQEQIARDPALEDVQVTQATVPRLADREPFDTILYVDVLEHIESDGEEMHAAYQHISPGGRVVVLSPAHQFLFTPFDKAIGHFRRYSRKTIAATKPEKAQIEWLGYLDSFGMLASLANRLFLQSASPSEAQIRFWDAKLVPQSRRFDRAFRYHIGKSVLMVLRKPPHVEAPLPV